MTKFDDNRTLDGFRIWDDGEIFLFLTTNSVEAVLGLKIDNPTGIIRGTDVVDIKTILITAEEANREDLIYLLDNSVNHTNITIDWKGKEIGARYYDDEINQGTLVPLANILPLINVNKIPRNVIIKLLKDVAIPLDEVPLLKLPEAKYLLDKYGRPTKLNKISKVSRGFATNASN